jgi:hypothetical protein
MDPAAEACEPTETDLTCEQAQLIIEPYFLAVQELFIAHEMASLGQSKLRKTRIECSIDAADTARHFAGCDETGKLIVFAPQLVELQEETVLGILAHEFGHALDFAYPGQYSLDDEAVLSYRPNAPEPSTDARSAQARTAGLRQWRARDPDTVERTADEIAKHVTGRHIGYLGPCLLQTLDEGRVRPLGLR